MGSARGVKAGPRPRPGSSAPDGAASVETPGQGVAHRRLGEGPEVQAQGCNLTILRGRVARPPVARDLPERGPVLGYELAVPIPGSVGRSETVPVVWSPNGAPAIGEGEEVVVLGRVRRRFFRSGGVVQSRTEVVAEQVLTVRQRARVARLLAEAAARLAGPST